MLLRWPAKVSKGKVIDTAYTSIDFAPTILSMMGVTNPGVAFHGIDGADEVLATDNIANSGTKAQTRFMTDSATSKWAAAVREDYKLVISGGEPWLFDLAKDPHEMTNVYGEANYTTMVEEMQDGLYGTMFQHKFPLAEQEIIYWSKPSCWDSNDQISAWKKRQCGELSDPRYSPGCSWRHVYEQCPVTCKRCCTDSPGDIFINGGLKKCKDVDNFCDKAKVRNFCPVTCSACPGANTEFGGGGTDDGGGSSQDDDGA